MMGFSGAVQWWEEWQLRVLVLASLFLHPVLPLRRRPSAQALHPRLVQIRDLAGLPGQRRRSHLRAGCSLQPTQEGGVGIRAPRERQRGGTVGAHLAGAPRRPGRDRCLQHRRQRAMDTACPNSSVSS